jgi:hypothetical protein
MILMTRAFKVIFNVYGIIGHQVTEWLNLEKNKNKKDEFMKNRNENNTRNRRQDNHRGSGLDNGYPFTKHAMREYRDQRDYDRKETKKQTTNPV